MELKRVVVDLDPALLEEAKSLVSEGRRAGRKGWPESLSALAGAALSREIASLRQEIRRAARKGGVRRS